MAFLISYLASRTWVTLRKQRGQALVEYALILILISVVCVVVLVTQGVTVGHMFSNVVCGFGNCAPPADVTPTPTPTPYCNGECRGGG